jgi:hypothetical protein
MLPIGIFGEDTGPSQGLYLPKAEQRFKKQIYISEPKRDSNPLS